MADMKPNELVIKGATIAFPYLFNRKPPMDGDGEGKYEAMILVPKDAKSQIKKIEAAIEEGLQLGVDKYNWPAKKVKGATRPLRDGDEAGPDDAEDHFFFNAKSGRKPGVYDADVRPIEDKFEVVGGNTVNVLIRFYPYDVKTNHGVGASLEMVQKIGEGDPVGGSRPDATSVFDAVDGDEDDII